MGNGRVIRYYIFTDFSLYFNVSIDELIGYEPQMMKEEIKSLYQRLCHDLRLTI